MQKTKLSTKLSIVLFILFGLIISQFLGSNSPVGEIGCVSKNSPGDLFLGPAQKFSLESPDFLLVQENSLKASLPPTIFSPQVLGALVGGYESQDIRKVIIEYVVESGDNLWSISNKFNISLESLLWSNDLNKNSIIQPGQKLVIPPVSGVIYHVKSGDTISEIAETYKGEEEEIIAFNDLPSEDDIFIGDILVIPDGVPPAPQATYAPQSVPLAQSYFICPIASPCQITQGLHWYNAIDFSHGKCGEPIYAAAGGEVLTVRLTNSTSQWAFGGAGNHITILHPNGVVTMYGHIQTSLVSPGQQVSQGQIIALMGGQPGTPGAGLSTGCHLHFGVVGARNPFAK
jgi:murein DD-endopeptidase MepM/ murein hydrolase activator NlpD